MKSIETRQGSKHQGVKSTPLHQGVKTTPLWNKNYIHINYASAAYYSRHSVDFTGPKVKFPIHEMFRTGLNFSNISYTEQGWISYSISCSFQKLQTMFPWVYDMHVMCPWSIKFPRIFSPWQKIFPWVHDMQVGVLFLSFLSKIQEIWLLSQCFLLYRALCTPKLCCSIYTPITNTVECITAGYYEHDFFVCTQVGHTPLDEDILHNNG